MHAVLSPWGGLALMIALGMVMTSLSVWVSRRRRSDRAEFLLASRDMSVLSTATSVAASWIWAPSLFVAAQKAYEQGIPGILWFIVPNFLCLVIFAPMANRLRNRLPNGFTFPQFIRARHGLAVHVLYLIQFFGLQIGCLAVQVLAGAALLEAVSNMNFSAAACLLLAVPLVYAILGGMRASIATDFLQMAVIFGVLGVTVPWTIYRAGGLSVLLAGLAGHSGEFGNVFNPWVAFSFGIPVTVSLLSGPLGDQMQWQRSFVVRSGACVRKTFLLGAVIFILVPLTLSLLGFTAAGLTRTASWQVEERQMVGPALVAHLLPAPFVCLFVLMILSSLCSTLDSVMVAVSTLVSADLLRNDGPEPYGEVQDRRHVLAARISMAVAAALALSIAHIPGLKVLHLFLFYGTWRASTMIPTILTLYMPRLNSRAVFASILASLTLGAPILAVGNYLNWPELSVAGSLLVVTIGLTTCLVGTWRAGVPAHLPPPDVKPDLLGA
jgi:urea-proton symporter